METTGIYRVTGNTRVVAELKSSFNRSWNSATVGPKTAPNVTATASLLKLYLREMPEPLFTEELHTAFSAGMSYQLPDAARVRFCAGTLAAMPTCHRDTALTVLDHMRAVVDHPGNKMTPAVVSKGEPATQACLVRAWGGHGRCCIAVHHPFAVPTLTLTFPGVPCRPLPPSQIATCLGPTLFGAAGCTEASAVLTLNENIQFLLEHWSAIRAQVGFSFWGSASAVEPIETGVAGGLGDALFRGRLGGSLRRRPSTCSLPSIADVRARAFTHPCFQPVDCVGAGAEGRAGMAHTLALVRPH